MYCRQCGAGIDPEAKFCEGCGAPQQEELTRPLAAAQANRKVPYAIGAAVVALAAVGVWFFWQKGFISSPARLESPGQSLAGFFAAILREDHDVLRAYLTQPNLEYLQRSGTLEQEATDFLLAFILKTGWLPRELSEHGRILSVQAPGQSLNLTVKSRAQPSDVFSYLYQFEEVTVIGDRATVQIRKMTRGPGQEQPDLRLGARCEMIREGGRWKPQKFLLTEGAETLTMPMDLAWLSEKWSINMRRRARVTNQVSALGSLRTINTAQITYASTYNQGYSPNLVSLGPGCNPPAAHCAGLIDEMLASGVKSGYRFTFNSGPNAGGRIDTYTLNADPITPGETGANHYFTDQTGVIRQDSSGPAGPYSPPLAG